MLACGHANLARSASRTRKYAMPEASIEIRVSRREHDRPRLIEIVAYQEDGSGISGLALQLRIEQNGTFDEEAEQPLRQAITGPSGHAYFEWYEYPRMGPRRDLTSLIIATWDNEAAFVYLQDLYE